MATITQFTENFEQGTHGAALTTSNTVLANVFGPATFSSDHAAEGDFGALTDDGIENSALRMDAPNPLSAVWFSIFVQIVRAADSQNTQLFGWRLGQTNIGDVQHRADGRIAIRDGATMRWQSVATFGDGDWVRVQVRCEPGSETGHQMRLFYGTNLYGTVPDEDSGDQTATNASQAEVDTFVFGHLQTHSYQLAFDYVQGDDATWPDPPIGATPLETPTNFTLSPVLGQPALTADWDPVVDAQSYELEIERRTETSWVPVNVFTVTAPPRTLNEADGMQTGVLYRGRVRAMPGA